MRTELVGYSRELDLQEDRDRQLDADVDERNEDRVDGGEDTEVHTQAELDDPLAAGGRDFLTEHGHESTIRCEESESKEKKERSLTTMMLTMSLTMTESPTSMVPVSLAMMSMHTWMSATI